LLRGVGPLYVLLNAWTSASTLGVGMFPHGNKQRAKRNNYSSGGRPAEGHQDEGFIPRDQRGTFIPRNQDQRSSL